MKATANHSLKNDQRPALRGVSRMALLLVVVVGAVMGGGYLYWRRAPQPKAEAPSEVAASPVLSARTERILMGLETPVELRWFVPLDATGLSGELRGYLQRTGDLLAEYERVAQGRLRVDKRDPQTDPVAKTAASAIGVVPFTSEDGEIIYLGLTISGGNRTESIAPLAPEWEAALEADISRAIQRVSAKAGGATASLPNTSMRLAPLDPALSDELLRQFPDLRSRAFDEMAQVLRLAALKEFESTAAEMQSKVTTAQKAWSEAQDKIGTVAAQEALRNFQRVQAEQADKLRGITARLQERIEVLARLTSER
jgi:hypothetical protein